MDLTQALMLSPLILVVAFLYSSVGHGGASGYLAVMLLFLAALAPREMSATALILNLLVAGLASLAYWRAGHFRVRLLLPFLITSIPTAFLGGRLLVPATTYAFVLSGALAFAAVRLFLPASASAGATRPVLLGLAIPIGAGIGLLSGIVGVGGGIFLSPLLLLFRWADPKQTAATSATFIWINSLSGLLGRLSAGTLATGPLAIMVVPAFLGGLLGSQLGARRFSGLTIRRILAFALVIAAGKLLLTAL
ncbi:MAG: sulfite exporter TauE/SafE family protein [Dehalococcoidia bacterium]|nr:sulfite exporter TauE/SafE family protein [Dehalococcoidia bacterium]